jgi:hypothetical protein
LPEFASLDLNRALCWDLATRRPVKYAPKGEILRDVFELMLDTRRHKQEVTCPKRIPLAIVKQDSASAKDEVNLVLCVRCLLPGDSGEGKGYVKSAAPEERGRVLTCGARDARFSLRETDHTTTIRVAQDLLLVHSN